MALDGASGADKSDGGGSGGVDKGTEDRVSAAMEQARSSRSDGDDNDGGRSASSSSSSPGAGEGSMDAAAEARASQDRLEVQGQAAKRSFEARRGAGPSVAEAVTPARYDAAAAPAAPRDARDWTPEERTALDRGAAQGAVDAGAGWVADVVDGTVEAAVTVGQAAVVGAETVGEASAALRGTEAGRALLQSNPVIDLAARAYEGVAALIPDAFADRQADALEAKGAAVIEELRALPDMPRAVIEKFDADIALADALEGAYRAGRADLTVLEESARVRAQAHGEAAILAAEVASLGAGGAGAAIRAARTLGRLDIDAPDGGGGLRAAMGAGAEAARGLADDIAAMVQGERPTLAIAGGAGGSPPGAPLTRQDVQDARAERTAQAARRHEPGTASGAGQPVGDDWMRRGVAEGAAPVPAQVAERMSGRDFADFDAYREAFWKEVAADPALAGQFNQANLSRMGDGLAPRSPVTETVGGRRSFEIDHIDQLQHGGKVYDADNLRVMTPRAHIERHSND